MAVRQYIGARYVPRFVGTYDPTQIYDALDVVDNGAGTSYIARKTVPAGTALTDTEFWFVYGASSGAIIQLQNDMIQAQNDIGSIQGDIVNIGNDINSINDDIDDLKDVLINKRMVVISDSYGLVRGGNTPWTTIFQTLTGLTNADYFTYSEGSMGINRTGDNGHNVLQLLQAHAGDITDADTITDVVIALGANDIYGVVGLATAIDNLFAYIKSTYVNAKMWLAYIGNLESKSLSVYQDYNDAVRQYMLGAGRNGAAYITGSENVMHNCKFFQSDGIHPTTDGCQAMAEYIYGYMNGGSSFTVTALIPIVSSYFGTGGSVRQTISNGIVTQLLTLANTSASLTLNAAGTVVDCGTVTDPIITGNGGAPHYGTVYIYNGSSQHVACQWYISGGHLYIRSVSGAHTIPSGCNSFADTISYSTIES